MTLSEFHNLSAYQQITFDEAQRQSTLSIPTYICFGKFPKTKEGKEFFKPFLDHKIIHADTLKFTGVFRLTKAGETIFADIQKQKRYGI